jgi:hypothetical protein
VFNCDCFERSFDFSFFIELRLVHQVIQPSAVEQALDFGEHCFDGIELRAVAYVEHGFDVQLVPPLLCQLGLMNIQLVHEQSQWMLLLTVPKLLQVTDEVLSVYSFIEIHHMQHAILCGHRSYARSEPNVN